MEATAMNAQKNKPPAKKWWPTLFLFAGSSVAPHRRGRFRHAHAARVCAAHYDTRVHTVAVAAPGRSGGPICATQFVKAAPESKRLHFWTTPCSPLGVWEQGGADLTYWTKLCPREHLALGQLRMRESADPLRCGCLYRRWNEYATRTHGAFIQHEHHVSWSARGLQIAALGAVRACVCVTGRRDEARGRGTLW
eukprot:7387838-Prymnesium_polylepis.2